MSQKIKNALISVSDKSNLADVLKVLKKNKINIISSGGTFKSITNLGYRCQEVSTFTGFDEMLEGRVKKPYIQKYMQVFSLTEKRKRT